jgi:hypothetical protein
MEPFIYQYRCDASGMTYKVAEELLDSAKDIHKVNDEGKREVECRSAAGSTSCSPKREINDASQIAFFRLQYRQP